MNKIRFFDGGMGTMLQAAGLLGPGALPEPLNLTHPEEIAAIHREYLKVGCRAVKTNTFAVGTDLARNQEKLAEELKGAGAVAEVK